MGTKRIKEKKAITELGKLVKSSRFKFMCTFILRSRKLQQNLEKLVDEQNWNNKNFSAKNCVQDIDKIIFNWKHHVSSDSKVLFMVVFYIALICKYQGNQEIVIYNTDTSIEQSIKKDVLEKSKKELDPQDVNQLIHHIHMAAHKIPKAVDKVVEKINNGSLQQLGVAIAKKDENSAQSGRSEANKQTSTAASRSGSKQKRRFGLGSKEPNDIQVISLKKTDNNTVNEFLLNEDLEKTPNNYFCLKIQRKKLFSKSMAVFVVTKPSKAAEKMATKDPEGTSEKLKSAKKELIRIIDEGQLTRAIENRNSLKNVTDYWEKRDKEVLYVESNATMTISDLCTNIRGDAADKLERVAPKTAQR